MDADRSRRAAPWRARALARAPVAALYAAMQALMELIARVNFGRVETLHRERFPARGAALIVANHPASWTDVVLLDATLDRKLHFLAHQPLFQPWPRRLLLALFSAVPVWHRHDEPDAAAHNRDSFDRCHALLGRGEVIAVFPEGVSGGARTLEPLKTGAARLLLDHLAGHGEPPALIPVAIHYEDRTAFRTRAVVEVGPPLAVAFDRDAWSLDPDAEAHALTTQVRRALEAALATATTHARAAAGPREADPRGTGTAPDAAGGRVAAPGVGQRDTRPSGAFEVLAAAAAAAGTALHAAPARAVEALARRWTPQPQRVAFGRIVFGLVVLPLWYAGLVALAAAIGGGAWFTAPAVAPVLGALACRRIDRRRAAARASLPGETP